MVETASTKKSKGTLSSAVARERTARLVRERREELGFTQESLAASAGVSVSTIKSMENVKTDGSFSERSVRAVEAALLWEAGSFALIQGGEDPLAVDVANLDNRQVHELRAMLTGRAHGGAQRLAESVSAIDRALSAKRVTSIDDETWDRLVSLALAEGRHVNDVLVDAIDLYERTLGPR